MSTPAKPRSRQTEQPEARSSIAEGRAGEAEGRVAQTTPTSEYRTTTSGEWAGAATWRVLYDSGDWADESLQVDGHL